MRKQNNYRVMKFLYVFKVSRLDKMDISDANKYAILGDELRLRREIEFGHRIDERDTISGRTILADAVAAGNIHRMFQTIHLGPLKESLCMYKHTQNRIYQHLHKNTLFVRYVCMYVCMYAFMNK